MRKRVHLGMSAFQAGCLPLALILLVFGCAGSGTNDTPTTEAPQRRPHYDYTHVYLRQLFFLEPGTLLFAVKTEGTPFLKDAWVTGAGGDPAVIDQIGCKVIASDPAATLVVIKPPDPVKATDAYFIALVVKNNKARYFTFEKINDLYNTGIEAALCEWTKSSHRNHRMATPKTSLQAFLTMLDHVLSKEEPPSGPLG